MQGVGQPYVVSDGGSVQVGMGILRDHHWKGAEGNHSGILNAHSQSPKEQIPALINIQYYREYYI
jgi:hypothetical protein